MYVCGCVCLGGRRMDGCMDVQMDGQPNLTTLCLNGTLSRVDFMDVIMGDIPLKVSLF